MTAPVPPAPDGALRFDLAMPRDGKRESAACETCGKPIVSTYWEADGKVLCTSCKAALDAVHGPDASAGTLGMGRAVLFGAGAAIAGAALYLGVLYFLELEVGLIAILVGWMVGKAVHKGSRGIGGRRFQILAVVLTYFAISVSYVPQMLMTMDDKNQKSGVADRTGANLVDSSTIVITAESSAPTDTSAVALAAAPQATTSDSTAGSASADVAATSTASAASDSTTRNTFQASSIGVLIIGALALLAIAPFKVIFAQFPGSLISALIIGFGLSQAWKLPARQPITFRGPYRLATPAGSAPPEPPDAPAT